MCVCLAATYNVCSLILNERDLKIQAGERETPALFCLARQTLVVGGSKPPKVEHFHKHNKEETHVTEESRRNRRKGKERTRQRLSHYWARSEVATSPVR